MAYVKARVFGAGRVQRCMSYMRESQLVLVGQGMRVDAVVKMLNDGQEQLMLGEVIEPGICQEVEAPGGVRVASVRRALQSGAVTCRRTAVHLALRQKKREVCNAKSALACASEVRTAWARAGGYSAESVLSQAPLACFLPARLRWAPFG